MQLQLQKIKGIITDYTSFEYAENMLQKERENFCLMEFNSKTGIVKEVKSDYYNYMKQTWHWEENPSLEACIENSRLSKLNNYADYVKMYTGWIENGKLFILHKREKLVTFLYKVEKDGFHLNAKPKTACAYIHYNPLNVDFVETSINHEYLFNGLTDNWNETYDISANEEKIIKECNLLISKN